MAHKNVIELLAPAGGPEPFNAALAAGADAIYCGLGNDFNARRSAKNFTEETFAEACRRAHLAGARVYVTVNVAIATHEISRVLDLVRRAWLLGADAFIIQDWGLFGEIRRAWPQIETHVSTQANIHDARGTAWCRQMGADRVTLSRELSLKEISRIAEEGVELECFGHGALCFCYSGVCMMSSLATGRSANRGLCAQPCRLPHDLVDEEGNVVEAPGNTRPLCPKDYCTVDHLQEMIDAGVGSLKVEGRMKAPDYVYNVVDAYREAIDATLAGRQMDAAEDLAVHRRLKRAFNRDFTDAYLMGTSGDEMMSYDRSNNRGEVVGTVASSRALEDRVARRGGGNGGRQRTRRYTQAEAVISLTEPVEKGDLLELRPVDDPSQFLTVHAEADAPAGATIACLAARPVPAGSIVSVIRSQNAIDAAARAAAADVSRRRPVTVRVVARLGQPFRVELACADGEATAAAEGFVVEAVRTRPVSQEDLVEHVGRMGGGPFEPVSFDVEMDEGCGMGFSAVHKVRAQAVNSLVEALLAPYGERQATTAPVPSEQLREERREAVRVEAGVPAAADVEPVEPCACALVADPECARAALEAGAGRVYATVDDLARGDWPEGVVPWLDEVCREADHARLDPWVRQGEPVAVGNISELALAAERGAAAEVRPCIPVHNKSALLAMEAAGAKAVWLSCELTLEEACELARAASVPVGLSVLGRERAMTSEHCVLQALGRCVHNCEKCPQRARRLSLKDIDGNLLPVRTDVNGRSRIWAAHPLDATPQADQLVEAGVRWLLADCTLLGPKETTFAVERVCRAIAAAKAGRRPAARLAGATSGHLFAGIG